MSKYTNREIVCSWDLWTEYVDPGASMSQEEWSAMPIDDRISLLVECFGDDETEDTEDTD